MLERKVLIVLLLALFVALQPLDLKAGLWLKPAALKQGEVFYITGDSEDALMDCKVIFDGRDYVFFRDVTDPGLFQATRGAQGFRYISRIGTTPLTKEGVNTVTISCPQADPVRLELNLLNGEFPLQSITLSPGKSSLQATDAERLAVIAAVNTSSSIRLWDSSVPWLKPSDARQSSAYGLRRKYNGVLAQNYFHKGLDFAGAAGSPIICPAAGKVILVGREADGFVVHGNCLFIDHGQGVVSAYLHLSEHSVAVGDLVEAGQSLGKIGDTGIATGPHLHFGLYVGGENVNPLTWLQVPME